jgi:hypothetical protein
LTDGWRVIWALTLQDAFRRFVKESGLETSLHKIEKSSTGPNISWCQSLHHFLTSRLPERSADVYYAPVLAQHRILRAVPIVAARRVVGARRHATGGALLVAVAALSIGACGSSKSSPSAKVNLNVSHVELSIEQSIFSERHLRAKVTCPAPVPQEKGRVFTCTATGISTTVKHGKQHKTAFTTPFTVTVQNSQGYVTYSS